MDEIKANALNAYNKLLEEKGLDPAKYRPSYQSVYEGDDFINNRFTIVIEAVKIDN